MSSIRFFHQRMELHRRLDRGLRVELGREGDLEEHVLHHVAAEGALELELLALEEHVVEAPGLRGEHRRIAHLAGLRDEREAHRARGGVARRPALPRAGVGRMAVGAQALAVDPGLRHRIDDLVVSQSHQLGNHGGGGHLDQHHVIEAHAVEAVFQREHALDLVGLDHRREDIAHENRASSGCARASRRWRGCRPGCRRDAPIRRRARCR